MVLLPPIAVALFLLLIGCAGPLSEAPACAGPAVRPNVVLILADDLGIGDVRATNPVSKIPTPNLDRLAAEGLTFLDAHSPSAVCTPTRYSLLTGRYSWRSRLARGVLEGDSAPLIPPDRATLGHLMRAAGYSTAMVGKWHLGWDWTRDGEAIDFAGPVTGGPDALGFDRYYAHAASLDMPPYVWVDTGRITAPPDRTEAVTSAEDRYGWYREGPIGADFEIDRVLPHLFGTAREHFREAAAAPEPFLLYLALPAPHTPIVPVPPFAGASDLRVERVGANSTISAQGGLPRRMSRLRCPCGPNRGTGSLFACHSCKSGPSLGRCGSHLPRRRPGFELHRLRARLDGSPRPRLRPGQ